MTNLDIPFDHAVIFVNAPITADTFQALELLNNRIGDLVREIAPKYRLLTTGKGLPNTNYRYESYEVWGNGDIEVRFLDEWQGGTEEENIRFPISILSEPNWEERITAEVEETKRIEREANRIKARIAAERKAVKDEEKRLAKEAEERALFEELRKKFGDQ